MYNRRPLGRTSGLRWWLLSLTFDSDLALFLPLTTVVIELTCASRPTRQAAERRRLPGEKELHARMRVFARYMPQAEHDDLVDALVLEQRLQHRIQARCSEG